MEGKIIQIPVGQIKAYPIEDLLNYPLTWEDPVYRDAVSFEVEVSNSPVGYNLSYRWGIIGNPGNWPYRLREIASVPPGRAISTSVFTAIREVWLPFRSRLELSPYYGDHDEFEEVKIFCEIKAEENSIFGNKEFLLLEQILELEPFPAPFSWISIEEKIDRALTHSIPFWPEGVKDAAAEFFTDPLAVSFLVGITIIFIYLALTPEPWAKIIGVLLGTALLAKFGIQTFESLSNALSNLFKNCKSARSEDDLVLAGRQFAHDCGEPVFNLLLALVFWRVSYRLTMELARIKSLRLQLATKISEEINAQGYLIVRPAEYLAKINSAIKLVRRMRFSEFIKVKFNIGRPFQKGVTSEKAFSLDEPYKFRKEHLKNKNNYFIEWEIVITEELRNILILAIDNSKPIPGPLRHLIRFKYENGPRGPCWNIIIPKSFWPEFQIIYTVIMIRILPIEMDSEDNEYSADEETFYVYD